MVSITPKPVSPLVSYLTCMVSGFGGLPAGPDSAPWGFR